MLVIVMRMVSALVMLWLVAVMEPTRMGRLNRRERNCRNAIAARSATKRKYLFIISPSQMSLYRTQPKENAVQLPLL